MSGGEFYRVRHLAYLIGLGAVRIPRYVTRGSPSLLFSQPPVFLFVNNSQPSRVSLVSLLITMDMSERHI